METNEKEPVSPFGWDLINDLSSLPENDDIIIDFLLDRLKRGQIYTWVGALLIAVNPKDEKSVENIYDSSYLEKYINLSDVISKNVTPHIFAIVAKAHYRFIHGLGKDCQMIIISGESGTGKTFNTYRALDFLVKLNNSDCSLLNQGDCVHNIVKRITNFRPLISAFSTASTEDNEESSRHGQLIKLRYKNGTILGATIHSFLLERSRVTKGASNFQIFYQMMMGLQETELENFGLSREEEYHILNTKNSFKLERYREEFEETLKAMDALNFTLEQKYNIFQIVALILHMGNIQFVEKNEYCTIDQKNEKSKIALKNVCTITHLREEDIEELLTTTLIMAQSTWRRHTAYRRNLNNINACQNRLHSIIRHLYDRLFHWLVDRINESLSVEGQDSKWFGILDIFGFEAFKINGMEQLCVNYANERLQQYFIEEYIEGEKRDLREEGLIDDQQKSTKVIHSYQVRLNVLEGALFSTLNDVSQSFVMPEISIIMKEAREKSYAFGKKFLSETNEGFVIHHYAGPIEYSIKDLVSKNTDKIPAEFVITFGMSENKFLCLLSYLDDPEKYQREKIFTKKGTTLTKLKYNLDSLIKELNNCDSHYVRCVKPRQSGNRSWEKEEFRKQLMCTGVFDALPLARCKYPIRFSYEEFYKRYSKKPAGVSNSRIEYVNILEIFADIIESNTSVYYGNRFVFLTESVFLKLENSRKKFRIQCANKIQTFWLTYRKKNVLPSPRSKVTQSLVKRNISSEQKSLLQYSINFLEDEVFYDDKENISNELKPSVRSITVSDYSSQDQILPDNSENVDVKFENNNCVPSAKDPKSDLSKTESYCSQIVDINSNRNNTSNANEINDFSNKLLNYTDSNFMYVMNGSGQEKKNYHSIQCERYMLFYKDRILSRQRLAEVPIKFHVRLTCLADSHKLPRSELPFGLQDCL